MRFLCVTDSIPKLSVTVSELLAKMITAEDLGEYEERVSY